MISKQMTVGKSGSLLPRIAIDTRWRGQHGIARFSREVIARLSIAWTPFAPCVSPLSPINFVSAGLLMSRTGRLLYTPGFNVAPGHKKQIVTLHDLMHVQIPAEASLWKTHYYNHVVRSAVLKMGVVLTVSETSKEIIQEWIGCDDTAVVNVGNGCSEAFFRIPGGRPAGAQPYFLYVGNMKPHKNAAIFLQALARLPETRAVLVTGDQRSALSLASAEGVADRVEMRAFVSDQELAVLYRNASALVMPSLLEGFGLPALEAIQCGTPVVYWNGCRAVREIVGLGGIGVDDKSAVEEWVYAMSVASTMSVPADWPPPERYRWSDVARRIESVLVEHE